MSESGRRILVTGGSACGKSSYAEALACALPGPRYYLATMRLYSDYDQERVQRHRAMRQGKGFITLERYTDLANLEIEEPGVLLLECLCNLTSNEMFDENWMELDPVPAVMAGIEALEQKCRDLVVVTNDVGSEWDGGAYSETTQDYVRALGTINCQVAQRFDTVLEFVAGIPQVIKGQLPDLEVGL